MVVKLQVLLHLWGDQYIRTSPPQFHLPEHKGRQFCVYRGKSMESVLPRKYQHVS